MFNEEKGVYMTHIAWDALVFITHPANPVSNITLAQAIDILSGKVKNWKEIGGPDKPIIKDSQSLDEIIDRSDKALYQAKNKGRNRVETSV